MSILTEVRAGLRAKPLVRRIGWVSRLQGLAIEAEGPDVEVGEMCQVQPRTDTTAAPVLTEVVGLEHGRVVLMPYGVLRGVAAGCEVTALGRTSGISVGPELLGRVLDAFGAPLDGRPAPALREWAPLLPTAINPLQRPRIAQVLETGVRAVDVFLTLGHGQRVGIFAGSGVGKSSLLGIVARHARADVHVVALIGERGREVREFVEEQLEEEGLRRSVVIVATSEQPALARIRAAHAAVAVARHFGDQGRKVLLTMDSVTRLAMARREVGLAAGEPATARGYTPSVFAELPQICERCGALPGGGCVTALLTVLVEGDDLNEPVADSMRSILDGHIVLSRDLAQQGHFPPIDLLRSTSRLLADLATGTERELVAEALRHLAVLERNRQLVELGAYSKGANPALDTALALEAPLFALLRQDDEASPRADALRQLGMIVQGGRTA